MTQSVIDVLPAGDNKPAGQSTHVSRKATIALYVPAKQSVDTTILDAVAEEDADIVGKEVPEDVALTDGDIVGKEVCDTKGAANASAEVGIDVDELLEDDVAVNDTLAVIVTFIVIVGKEVLEDDNVGTDVIVGLAVADAVAVTATQDETDVEPGGEASPAGHAVHICVAAVGADKP